MTISKTLARETVNGKEVTAIESYEKFSSVPYYQIIVIDSDCDIVQACDITNTSRTTWKRKFRQVVSDLKDE